MNGEGAWESDLSGYVEVDPTGRYGRFNEVLGKGAFKTVYRGFDEYEGIEVAWNQVKLTDFLQRPEDLERLYSEIHLLRTLKHSNIMKFFASWVDPTNRNINFVTELFTSGTLRQYRLKHKKVNIRAVKHWCRQILNGLLYLHSLDPPVIHRDLKCDNIFINGNQGQVKIGDLGLAAILRKSYAAHCVGTPEFMAPEVYEEEYNELVDIYSFGMCVLEMVTFEYPYSECTHPAQIYKKVISGKKPDALYKVKDPEVRRFVEKCLATVSCRLPASELLKDPFLQTDGNGYDLRPIDYYGDYDELCPLVRVPSPDTRPCYGSLVNSGSDYVGNELDEAEEIGIRGIDLFMSPDRDHLAECDITIKGKKRGDGHIFLRLRIADKEGHVRNIYFPFDIDNDTALSVATEMVSELDIVEQDVTKIAELIDGELASLVPSWNRGLSIEEEDTNLDQCIHSTSIRSLASYASSDSPSPRNLQVLHCSGHTSGRGRFEEITYKVEANQQSVGLGVPAASSSQFCGTHQTDFSAQHIEVSGSLKKLSLLKDDAVGKEAGDTRTPYNSPVHSIRQDDHESRIRKDLRWLKAKYQMQLRDLRDQQLGAYPKAEDGSRKTLSSYPTPVLSDHQSEPYYKEVLLHRATSLPIDAVDC